MIDEKKGELENLEASADQIEEYFDDEDNLENFEDLGPIEGALEEQASGRSRERLWLYIGLAALLSAVLLRLILAPILDTQKQRTDQVAEITSLTQLANVSAAKALTAGGEYKLMESEIANLQQRLEELVQPQSFAARIANQLFGNTEINTQLSADWGRYQNTANKILAKKETVAQVKENLAQLNALVSETVGETIAFVDAVAKEGRGKRTGDLKDRYLFLTSAAADLNGTLSRLSSGFRDYYEPQEDLQKLSADQNARVVRLKDTLTRIVGNADAVVGTAAEPLQARFDSIDTRLLELSENASAITESRADLQQLEKDSLQLLASAKSAGIQQKLVSLVTNLTNILPLLLVAFGIFAMWRFFSLQSQDLVQSEGSLSDALADQQDSILKLLDEMSALADGDLTVEAEVTDQITGAIADSVNFAVIEMRELVSQINRASVEVANESELAVSNAQAVSQSNKVQADQITTAAKEMQRVTASMREMSEQASKSSEMATESIQAATQGAQAVRDTITGMEDMRDQIQETSKRIKRLGESSQRIGDIVALIDDIAEQTNILSLNAAIQASMAGEAGRGFAVVSDEVQSLAERSTEATKKIAELVTTIQNDTNDAVASMEQATQQVVAGTKVADTAGNALAEIENVSNSLSSLIQTIAQRSNQQAEVVTDVAEKVTTVSDSSAETSRKAQDSANSIAKLLELAKELETSVSRFKLPAA